MWKYLAFSRNIFVSNMAYRTDFFIGVVAGVVSLLVAFFIWSAVYGFNNVTELGGLTLAQMMTYITLSIFLGRTFKGRIDYFIEQDVRSGNLTSVLAKPISYVSYNFAKKLGHMAYFLVFGATPIFVLGIVMFRIAMPSFLNAVLFAVSLLLGSVLIFSFIFLTGLSAFWTTGRIWGIRVVRDNVSQFFGGAYMPLYIFPPWLAQIALFTPFPSLYHTPLSIYLGLFTVNEIVNAMALQAFWAVVFLIVSWFAWKRAHNKFTSQGG